MLESTRIIIPTQKGVPMYTQNYFLTKAEKKTLKKMRNKTHTPESQIYNCFELYQHDFIQRNHTSETDDFNAPIPDGTYRLTMNYWRYIESTRWFNAEYVLSHILVPIFVSLTTFFITTLLTGVISLPL